MTTTLASEAARQNARRKAFERENKLVSSMLQEPDKLRSLAEKVSMETDGQVYCFKTSKRRTLSPDKRQVFVNQAFNVDMDQLGPLPSARPQILVKNRAKNVTNFKSGMSKRILDSGDVEGFLKRHSDYSQKSARTKLFQNESYNKRVYVTQPPIARRRSVDDRLCVTVYSSEKQSVSSSASLIVRDNFKPCYLTKNTHPSASRDDSVAGLNPLTRNKRVMSYPSPAFDSWQDELKYWKSALKTSSKLRALEK